MVGTVPRRATVPLMGTGDTATERRDMANTPDRLTLIAFVLMVVTAGGNAVAVRYISCETCELEPFWAAASRFLLAALLFAVIARAARATFPRGRALVGSILYGAFTFGGAFAFAYWALVRIHAGLGQVLLATVPLITFILALVQRQERFRWNGLVGAALAVGGTAVIFLDGLDEGLPLTALLAAIGSAVCFAQGALVVKRFPPVHPLAMNAVGMGAGGALLLALSAIQGEPFIVPEGVTTWAAQVYLVIGGSIAVFGLYVFVLQRWTASAVSYEFVLIPPVTIVLSVWLQDERISWAFLGGSVLVLVGVYFGALLQTTRTDTVASDSVPDVAG